MPSINSFQSYIWSSFPNSCRLLVGDTRADLTRVDNLLSYLPDDHCESSEEFSSVIVACQNYSDTLIIVESTGFLDYSIQQVAKHVKIAGDVHSENATNIFHRMPNNFL